MKNTTRVLVLAPHTDDGELGCGATIARFVEEGREIYYAAFSTCDKSIPPEYPPDALKREVKSAMEVLGVPRKNLLLYDYEVRTLASRRQEVLEELVALKKELAPDLVLLPSMSDLHQDHYTVALEGLRAFKRTTMLGYEQPWNHITFNTMSFVIVEGRHLDKKTQALKCYETQNSRKYMSEQFVRGLARTRGTQIDEEYAEAYEVLRWVIR